MRRIFADAVYWIALTNRKDQWHQRSLDVNRLLGEVLLITTDEVLDEFLTFFSGAGKEMRQLGANTVRRLLSDPSVLVLPQSRNTFLTGLTLFEDRPDKGYSLTDCISMVSMRQAGIFEVLTHDMHFAQEGFAILL